MARRRSEGNGPATNVDPNDEADCFDQYSAHMATIAREKQAIAAMFKRYEKLGVGADEIKHAYRMEFKDDAAAVHRRRTATMLRLGIIAYEADGQGNFMGGLNVQGPTGASKQRLELGRARADGYNTAYAGGSLEACKFAVGSEEYVTWRDGWTDGNNDRLRDKPDAAAAGGAKTSQPEDFP